MIDVILEIIRAFVIGIILVYLWQVGRKGKIYQSQGWRYILSGFLLLFIGMIVDITDNFPSLNKYIVIGDTVYQAFLEKIVGYLFGFILLAVGFWKWIPTVNTLWSTQHQLRKRQDELQKSEEKYRRLVESMERDYIIYSRDIKGIFTYLSPSIINVLGYTQDEFMGHYSEYMTDSPINKDIKRYTDVGLCGEKQLPYEAEFWHKDGSRCHLEVTEIPIIDNKGNVLCIDGIIHDVTARKKIEIMKENAFREISHELKTPIAMIKMVQDINIKAIENNDINQIKKTHRIISENIERLSKDVNNILSMFVLKRKMDLEKSNFLISTLIDDVVRNVQYVLAQKKIKIKIDIQTKIDKIYADQHKTTIMLNNLLDNAIKFTDKGSIFVTVGLKSGFFIIEIKDTGSGISSKIMGNIFGNYYKRHPAIPGTGLGLTISKEIAEMHGGRIEISSEGLGKGTTVTVYMAEEEMERSKENA